MTEKQYKELLHTLGISVGKSSADVKELLGAKHNEYLDRTDAEAEKMVSDIEDALDYVESLIEKMGGGIALVSEESEDTEEISQDSFAGRTAERKRAISYTPSSFAGGATATTGNNIQSGASLASPTGQPRHPWFFSVTGDINVDSMFVSAEGDLQQGYFQYVESAFDSILRIEANNAGAYLGKVLAKYNLFAPKDIATCFTQGLENDANLKRIEICGNDKQKKFIEDALEERRKAMIYLDAESRMQKQMQKQIDAKELQDIMKKFDELGDYRDASQKADFCRTMYNEFIYQEALDVLDKGTDPYKLMEAKTILINLGDYKDAASKLSEVDDVIDKIGKNLVEKEKVLKKYKEEWKKEQQSAAKKAQETLIKIQNKVTAKDWWKIIRFNIFNIINIIIVAIAAYSVYNWARYYRDLLLYWAVTISILVIRSVRNARKKILLRRIKLRESFVIVVISIVYCILVSLLALAY